MKIYLFYHSVISDWSNGNAHFLRGVITSLVSRGNKVKVYEPAGGWSLANLLKEQGLSAYYNFIKYYSSHTPVLYSEELFNPEEHLTDADLVIVSEWTDPGIVKKIGDYRKQNPGFTLFFHDTHHRAVTKPQEPDMYDLSGYDGILASGKVISDKYIRNGWAGNVWIWHEAADLNVFHPLKPPKMEGDLVWIGNWGDEERSEELEEFLIKPSKDLKLKTTVYGVRYPEEIIKMLKKAKIDYRGWIPNYKVPEAFSKFRLTVNIPKRKYAEAFSGIPAIRMFEAMACGIPLISSPWKDTENLFTPGKDYLPAIDGEDMKDQIRQVLGDRDLAREIQENALTTILDNHTCDHRVDELERILSSLNIKKTAVKKTAGISN